MGSSAFLGISIIDSEKMGFDSFSVLTLVLVVSNLITLPVFVIPRNRLILFKYLSSGGMYNKLVPFWAANNSWLAVPDGINCNSLRTIRS